MAYSEILAKRIREKLKDQANLREMEMMGGLCFMLNDKMCVGIIKDDLMCRVDPDIKADLLEKTGCSEMMFTGRPLKGFVLVDETGMRNQAEFDRWVDLCLEYNPKAQASKKKRPHSDKSK
ncbi:MAG: TfoX/Sxy family protein [Cytophagaceae bacterium]|nr:TfoX/Sxy family protein [Cytophagaceae bacterium]MBK9935211.1 TfoX/Sxy family protein [Cytophagaceae bacterium]MBL0301654.1 TfoX/Sxy family protein [Cytophagaceae bacterium]MBL0324479.1 TfoX/Sxy family protein [Cytophagaceae bacterium]